MVTISNLPAEVFAAALDYERIGRPGDISDSQSVYFAETSRRNFTDGGIERAISEHLMMRGPFAEDSGEFAGVSGYSIS